MREWPAGAQGRGAEERGARGGRGNRSALCRDAGDEDRFRAATKIKFPSRL